MICLPSPRARAGVLRRFAAFAFDILFFTGVLSIVGPIAFALSDGRVQMDGLLPLFSDCGSRLPIPQEINLAPAFGDAAVACSAGALPRVVSSRYLVVSVTTRTGSGGTSLTFEIYPLSVSGHPIKTADITWLGRVGLLAYFIIGLAARGRTLGMRLTGIRLFAVGEERADRGARLPMVLVRTCAAIGGFALPALALAFAFDLPNPPLAYTALFVGMVGPIAWIVTNIVLVASDRDPIYDRLASVTVSVVRS